MKTVDLEKAKKMYLNFMPVSKVAKEFNISIKTLYRIFDDNGIKRRGQNKTRVI